jgi:non-heme chloroperoxidase
MRRKICLCMPRCAETTRYCPEAGWNTLFAYERAFRQFTANPSVNLSYTAFAGLSAIDVATLPPPSFFSARDGLKLGFRCYEADSRIQLVLIHGAGCFADQMHQIADRVAKTGRARVYTLNMRGHGLSEGERGHAVTGARQIVEDVSEFLMWLKARRPNDRIVLAGHSAGGGVVLGVSRTRARDLVSGYIFLAPYLGLGSPTIRPHFGGWVKVRGRIFRALILLNLFGIKRFNQTTVVEFNMDACLHDPRFVRDWSFNTTLAFGPGNWLADATTIPAEKPVLVLAGELDECFVQALYPEAFQIIAPHANMPAIGPRGHWNILVDPWAIAALEAWLDEKVPNMLSIVEVQEGRNEAAA